MLWTQKKADLIIVQTVMESPRDVSFGLPLTGAWEFPSQAACDRFCTQNLAVTGKNSHESPTIYTKTPMYIEFDTLLPQSEPTTADSAESVT